MSWKLCFSCQAPKYLTVEYLRCGTTSAYETIANESQKKYYNKFSVGLWVKTYSKIVI